MNLSKLSSACLLAGAGWTGLVNAAPCGGNLLTNPGFEQGGAGWSLASAEVVPGGHDGQSSLFYQNHNPANYHNMVQTLAVKPGQQVAFGVWASKIRVTAI